MSTRFIARVIAGAAFGGAALLIAVPGIATADDPHHDRDHKKAVEGWVYAYPDHTKADRVVHIVQICKHPVQFPSVESKATGVVELGPGTDPKLIGHDKGKKHDKHHEKGKRDDKGGKGPASLPLENAQDAEAASLETDRMAEDTADRGERDGKVDGDQAGAQDNPKDPGRKHDKNKKHDKGKKHDERGKHDDHGKKHDDRGKQDDHGKKDAHDKKDEKGKKDAHDKKDDKRKKDDGKKHDKAKKDHDKKQDNAKKDDRKKHDKRKHDDHPWAYFGEALIPEGTEPGTYTLKGDCGEGKLTVVPSGWVKGGDGGGLGGTTTTGASAGMLAGGAGVLAAAAIGGTVLLRRRTTDGSLA